MKRIVISVKEIKAKVKRLRVMANRVKMRGDPGTCSVLNEIADEMQDWLGAELSTAHTSESQVSNS